MLISLNGNDIHTFNYSTLFSELNSNKKKAPTFPVLHRMVCSSPTIILHLSASLNESEVTLHSYSTDFRIKMKNCF